MATLHELPGANITKPRPKMMRPILKKMSHSEKDSLDLDRSWEEQNNGWGSNFYSEAGDAGRAARDVNFSPRGASGGVRAGAGGALGGGSSGRLKFQHERSVSGTSHVSHASHVSNGSGGPRPGSFVHPFQQTPLTLTTPTPPTSYPASRTSSENNRGSLVNGNVNGSGRAYSPTITEDDVDEANPRSSLSYSASYSQAPQVQPPRRPTPGPQRSSFGSHRTASYCEATGGPGKLRINTGRSTPGSSARLAHGVANPRHSSSDFPPSLTAFDSPTSPSAAAAATGLTSNPSPSMSTSPMSPLRSSLDGIGIPRLRSRSELDTSARVEHIRQARRKFQERERAKEEKWDREQIKKQERRETKEASRNERAAGGGRPSMSRKNTPTTAGTPSGGGSGGGGSGGVSSAIPEKLRKSLDISGAAATWRSRDSGVVQHQEKRPAEFLSSNYASVEGGTEPKFGHGVEDVRFNKAPKRTTSAKRKTHGYWTSFILWLRTRLLRMGRRD